MMEMLVTSTTFKGWFLHAVLSVCHLFVIVFEDYDECGFGNACENGVCVNTAGSFDCFCSPPLVLDGTRRRCITVNTTEGETKFFSYRVARSRPFRWTAWGLLLEGIWVVVNGKRQVVVWNVKFHSVGILRTLQKTDLKKKKHSDQK